MTSINYDHNLALKDIDSKLISLGHLAGQLGGFVGESESVKEAVIYAIKAYFDTNEDLKTDLNDAYSSHVTKLSESVKSVDQAGDNQKISELSQRVTQEINDINQRINSPNNLYNLPSSPSPSAELAKLHSKLDALRKVEELCENYKNLKNASNNPKNLLDNLCDGLQTFLGYDKNSKGYTGQGIVYSDLDRLCDGVMGFLSGVLKDVHENDNLSPYKNTLETAVNTLNENLNKGKKGLQAVIEPVKKGIAGWLGEVNEKNKKVMRPLENLLESLNGHKSANMEHNPITDQLATWRGFSSLYVQDVEKSEHALNDIDGILKTQVEPKIDLIRHVVRNFWTSVNDDSVINSVSDLTDKFLQHRSEINDLITNDIQKVLEALNENYTTIENKIDNIKQQKRAHMQHIVDAVSKTQQLVDGLLDASEKGFDKNYHQQISKLFTTIKTNIERFARDNGTDTMLQTQFSIVQTEVKGLEDDVRAGLEVLESHISGIDRRINDDFNDNNILKSEMSALQTAKEALEKLTGKKNNDDGNLENNFENKIKGLLSSLLTQVETAIGKLHGVVTTGDAGEGKEAGNQKIELIIKHIQEQVDRINKGELGNHSGIHGISANLDEYARQFKTKFESAIRTMVQGIVSSEGAIKQHIDQYVNSASMRSLRTRLNKNTVKEALKLYVKAYISKLLMDAAANAAGLDGIKTLSELFDKLSRFGRYLEGYLISDQNAEQTLSGAVVEIEGYLQSKGIQVLPDQAPLRLAIRILLACLHSGAKGAVDDISVFIRDSDCSKLRTVSHVSQILGERLKTVMRMGINGTNYASAVDDAIKAVKTEVEQNLVTKFNSEVKNGLPSAITKFHNNAIKQVIGGAKTAITEALDKFKIKSGESQIDVRSMMTQFDESERTLQSAVRQIKQQLDLLKKVPNDVDGKRQNADDIMKQLKSRIQSLQFHITAISPRVANAQKAFDSAIAQLDDSVRDAKSNANLAMSALKISLQRGIGEAFGDLEDGIQQLFAAQKKAELQAIHASVSDELPKIRSAIEEDLASGIKGLMKWINKQENEVTRIQEVLASLTTPTHPAATAKTYSEVFLQISEYFKNYVDLILRYAQHEVSYVIGDSSKSRRQPTEQSERVRDIKTVLDNLLNYLNKNSTRHCSFDHIYASYLTSLNDSLSKLATLSSSTSALDPQALPDAGRPVLKALQAGMLGFVGELGKGYVSRYSMETFKEGLTTPKGKEITLTDYGRKCAKVCLSIVPMVSADMRVIYEKCNIGGEWLNKKINSNTYLGEFFAQRGYKVSTKTDSHDGILRNKDECQGSNIKGFLTKMLSTAAINNLTDCLRCYHYVCHLRVTPSPKSPTTVFAMLKWCAGLRYNAMLSKVEDYTKTLFSKPKKYEDRDYKDISVNDLQLVGTSTIKPRDVCDAIYDVCRYAKTILIAILGHGHNDGVYACDFSANEDGFSYPVNPADCFDTLVDVAYRLHDQLYFLLVQCQRTSKANSWRDCWYGRYVGGSDWRCNTLQCANQDCNQKGNQKPNQKGNQAANQICDEHPKCGVKSPLQSYLEDGLPGFLPHKFDKVGCKAECTVSNHRGITCKTPLGFGNISNVASHTKQGEHIGNALERFCGNSGSPLSQLCKYLTCLLSTPPKTLGDMFAFYYNFLYGWQIKGQGKDDDKAHREDAFDDAVTKAYFGERYTDMNVSLLFDRNHSEHNKNRDLLSLVCGGDSKSVTNCGRYLQPISANTWTVFSKRNAANYLSWIVYLTESFYNLLHQLYEECCKNCTSAGSRCHGKTCVPDCKVKSHYASLASAAESKTPAAAPTDHHHNQLCKPISHCPFTRPTFCKYGFVFKSLSNMSGENGEETMRTCKDLCNALQKVLSDKISDGAPLAKLVHEVIPKFIWAIREKFFWTTVALWLLSFLYLLHIMVIRLDTLHIKSHLHSPSSHRIAAQSLLAAARVNKLNKLFYLQP
ncbi:hypothetical protein, conserved [Babesia bigemina]|uniref:C3H1-type domain-containing protein n=1 Tax=Babesia bigemina TaxID=5866 RepID=A0A061BQL2_BABBI|nr:hypothetical protein, conserved [Babesia bigemina]CDR71763.1 hypothetical protein, conserved [Babesia bigemina]|eukprot:XP_012770708.1 hypothetical protein, conserved [Babesia bigemina]